MNVLSYSRRFIKRIRPTQRMHLHNVCDTTRNVTNSKHNVLVYTAEEQLQIIGLLHKCVENNITRSYLNEKRLESLRLLFDKHPNMTSLEPLLTVSGFGPRLLSRICDSLLHAPADPKEDNKTTHADIRLSTGYVTPTHIVQSPVEKMVSITLGVNIVSWARLSPSGQLDSWDYHQLDDCPDKRYDVHSVWHLAMKLRSQIPDADMYVMENNSWSNVANIKKPMKYHIYEAMLTSAICSIFNHSDVENLRLEMETINRVYFLKKYTAYRLFDKIIGSERVSAQDLVADMLGGANDERHQPVSAPEQLVAWYQRQSGATRDVMCQALLLVITFNELILLKNRTAISVVSKPYRKKKNQETER